MLRTRLLLCFLFAIAPSSFAQAGNSSCTRLLRPSITNVLYSVPEKSTNFDSDAMRALARTFIDSNPFLLESKDLLPSQIIITRIEQISKHPYYPGIRIHYEAPGRRYAEPYSYIEARSNGGAIFIRESYEYSQDPGFKGTLKAVIRTKRGAILSINQTLAILDTLPEEVVLSRVMTEGEFKIWTQGGDVKTLTSRGAGGGTRAEISTRSTFALNYFEFGGDQPVIYRMPRKVFEDLLERRRLVINTYDDILDPHQGMSKEALTPFGLEVEIAVLGNDGREAIRPYMENPIEVPKEFPIRLVGKYRISEPKGLNKAQREKWLRQLKQELYEKEKAAGLQ